MEHQEIADRVGVNLSDLESLRRGKCTANVASRLGVSPTDIENFIRGYATNEMKRCLGLQTINAAAELARATGANGAIGIVFGLLLTARAASAANT